MKPRLEHPTEKPRFYLNPPAGVGLLFGAPVIMVGSPHLQGVLHHAGSINVRVFWCGSGRNISKEEIITDIALDVDHQLGIDAATRELARRVCGKKAGQPRFFHSSAGWILDAGAQVGFEFDPEGTPEQLFTTQDRTFIHPTRIVHVPEDYGHWLPLEKNEGKVLSTLLTLLYQHERATSNR